MKKHFNLLLVCVFICIFSTLLFACTAQDNQVTITSVNISGPTNVVSGEFSVNNYKLVINYSDGSVAEVNVGTNMISSEDIQSLQIVGKHTINVKYNNTSYSLEINVLPKEFSGLAFKNLTIPYDGKEHSLEVENLPEGATVQYTPNTTFTEVGEYNIKASISMENFQTVELSAKLVITEAEYDTTKLTYQNQTIKYDNEFHLIELENIPEGATVTYDPELGFKEVGTHKQKVTIKINNYKEFTLQSTLVIEKGVYDQSNLVFGINEFKYDGQYHKLEISNLPEGATVLQNPSNGFKEAGTHDINITIKSTNYEDIILNKQIVITREEHKIIFRQEGQNDIVYKVLDLDDFTDNPTAPQQIKGYDVSWDTSNVDFSRVTKNIIVGIKKTPIIYNIAYVLNGANNIGSNPKTYNIETSDIYLQAPPINIAKAFDGWYTTETFDEGTKIEIISQGTTGNLRLYAKWSDYKVTKADGFEIYPNVSPNLISKTVPYSVSSIDMTPFIEVTAGCSWEIYWDFDCLNKWSYNSAKLEEGYNNAYLMVTYPEGVKGHVRYALSIYRKHSYEYSFISDGNVFENGNIEEGLTIEKPATDPSKVGYDFNGWVIDNELITFPYLVESNVNFLAKFTPITYTINFVVNSGSINSNKINYTILESKTFEIPTRDHYVFEGWYDNDKFEGSPIKGIEANNTGDKTYYAKWVPYTYHIVCDFNDGIKEPQDISYNIESENVILPIPERVGYTFVNWTKNGEVITQVEKGTTGDINVIANWKVNTYTIAYDITDDVNNPNLDLNYTIESENIILKPATRPGYTFVNWTKDGEVITQINRGSTGDITVVANWKVITYDITYDITEDVTNPNKDKNYTIESEDIVLKPATRPGYTFVNWTKDGEAIIKINKGSIENVTLVPVWKAIIYTITYDLTEDVLNPNLVNEFNVESNTIVLGNPTRSGYKFVQWNKNGAKCTQIDKGTIGNVILIPIWEIITYTITYDLTADVENSNSTVEYNINTEDIILQAPSRIGYDFVKWTSNGQEITQINKGSTGNIVLTPVWKVITYTITYDVTDDVLNPNQKINFNIESSTIVLEIPTRKGYNFVNWTKEGEVITEIAQGTVGNITLVANWAAIEYTITYSVTEDVVNPNETVTYTIESENIVFKPATRPGYTFANWIKDGEVISQINSGSIGDIVLTPNWTAIEYTITYNVTGDVVNPNETIKYTIESENIVFKPATRLGYTFVNWTKDGAPITQIDAGSIGNCTLVANWEVITYTITYDVTGDVVNPNKTINYTIESENILLQDPERVGYTFINWTKNGKPITQIENGSTGNVTIKANWSVINYTITYDVTEDVVNPNEIVEYNIETPTINLGTPERVGYTFVNWTKDGEPITEIAQGTTGHITLVTNWTAIEYIITYNVTDDVENPNILGIYTIESENIDLQSATRPGYTFVNWTQGGEPIAQITKGSTGNVELIPTWTPITYTITYDVTEDVVNPNSVVEFNIETNQIILQSPTRPGYTFVQWLSAGQPIVTIDKGTIGNITLVPVWEIITYSITYQITEDVVNPNNINTFTIESENIVLQEPTRLGYNFVQWNKNNQKYTQIETGTIGDIILMPVWEAKINTIVYDGNNADKGSMDNTTIATGESAALANNLYSRVGYKFIGWSKIRNGEVVYKEGAIFNMDSTPQTILYAVWEIIEYKITYHLNEGEFNPNPSSYNVNSGTIVLKPATTSQAKIFDYWYVLTIVNEEPFTDLNDNQTWDPEEEFVDLNNNGHYDAYKDNQEFEYHKPITNINSRDLHQNIDVYACFVDFGITETVSFVPDSENPTKLLMTVPNSKDIIDLSDNITVTSGCSWDIYWDYAGQDKWAYHAANLAEGNNTAYLIITHPTTTVHKRYTLSIYRKLLKTYTFKVGGENYKAASIDEGTSINAPTSPEKTGYTFDAWYIGEEKVSFPYVVNDDVELVAKFKPINYNLTFNLNYEIDPILNTYTILDKVDFEVPSRQYYTFKGWYDNDLLEGESVLGFEIGQTGDKTYYAKWELNKYEITYELNGGKNHVGNPTTFTPLDLDITLNAPTRDGYTFARWEKDGLPIETIPSGTEGNITLQAIWEANSHTIIFNGNGCDSGTMNSITVLTDENRNLPANTFVKVGYTFIGWALSESAEVTYVNEEQINLVLENSITLYAVWDILDDIVLFKGNGATSGSMEIQNVVISQNNTLNAVGYKKDGYKFIGWSLKPEGRIEYTDCDLYYPTNHKGITLYANWEIINYSITYELDGGVNNSQNPVNYTIESENITLLNPTKELCDFIRWELNGQPITEITKGSTGNITLNAIWKYKDGCIFFNGNGATSGEMNGVWVELNQTINLPNNMFEKNGYTFVGWSLSSTGEVVYQDGGSYTRSDNNSIELFAIWDKDTRTITYKYDNKEVKTDFSVDKLPLQLSEISSFGKTFVGWYTEPNCINGITEIRDFNDITLYAKYNVNTNGLEFTLDFNNKYSVSGFTGNEEVIYIPAYIGDKEVYSIKSNVFNATSIRELYLPSTLTNISSNAFSYLGKLTKIYVEPENNIFKSDNTCLINSLDNSLVIATNNITMPEVDIIRSRAFNGLETLNTITIPASVKVIQEGAFVGCGSLNINVDLDNKNYQIQEESLIELDTMILIAGNNTSSIPYGVKRIGAYAFYNCSELAKIFVPGSVLEVGEYAFSGCSKLKKIELPHSIGLIEKGAMSNCTSLKYVRIPFYMDNYDPSILSGCNNIITAEIPYNLADQFLDISHLRIGATKEIDLSKVPNNVSIEGLEGVEKIYGNPNNLTIIVPTSIRENNIDGNNTILTKKNGPNRLMMTIPSSSHLPSGSSVNSLNWYYDEWMAPQYLVDLEIISKNSQIVNYKNKKTGDEFGTLYNIGSATVFPEPLNNIPILIVGYQAFRYTFPHDFNRCIIPDSVMFIDNSAFEFQNMVSLSLPRNLKFVGEYAFSAATITNYVEFRGPIDEIGQGAFDFEKKCREFRYYDIYDSLCSAFLTEMVGKDNNGGILSSKKPGGFTYNTASERQSVVKDLMEMPMVFNEIPFNVRFLNHGMTLNINTEELHFHDNFKGSDGYINAPNIKRVYIKDINLWFNHINGINGSPAIKAPEILFDLYLNNEKIEVFDFNKYRLSNMNHYSLHGANIHTVILPDGLQEVPYGWLSSSAIKKVYLPSSVKKMSIFARTITFLPGSSTIDLIMTNVLQGSHMKAYSECPLEVYYQGNESQKNSIQVVKPRDFFEQELNLSEFTISLIIKDVNYEIFPYTWLYYNESKPSSNAGSSWHYDVNHNMVKWNSNNFLRFNNTHIEPIDLDLIESNIFTLPEMTETKVGYKFVGWEQKNETGHTIKTYENMGQFVYDTSITNGIDLYPIWEEKEITIVFNGNGSSYGSMNSIIGKSGARITLPKNTFIKNKYLFKGWSLSPTGPVLYQDCENIKVIDTDDPIINLYAVWELPRYDITYVLNGGKNSLNNPSYLDKESNITFENPTRVGYEFIGWYLDCDFVTPITGIKPGTETAVKIYAKWKIINYNITYQVGDNEFESLTPNKYNIETETFTFAKPKSRKGYKFLGWKLNDSFVSGIEKGSIGHKNLIAEWEIINYKITYNVEDGVDIGSNLLTYNINTPTIELQPADRSGYTFKGWLKDGQPITQIESGSIGEIILTPTWEIIEYKIAYEISDGSLVNNNPTHYNVETETIVLSNFDKAGYDFYWTSNGQRISEIRKGSVGNMTLVANWDLIQYKITYDVTRDVENPNSLKTYNIESENIVLQEPTRSGYNFIKWTKDGQDITQIDNGSTGDVKLVPVWEVITYSITYTVTDDVINPNKEVSFNVESNAIVLENPTRPGYTFVSWTKNGTPITQINRGTIGNVTLVANWKAISYTITYNVTPDVVNPNDTANYTIESNNIILQDPTRAGYTFVNWTKSGEPITQINSGSMGDVELVANWTPITYTITYDVTEDVVNPNDTLNYTIETDSIILQNPTRKGHTFVNWTKGGAPISQIDKGSIGNITLVANWEVITYTITYDVTDDVVNPNIANTYTIESENIVFEDPSRTGYTFVNWTKDGTPITQINKGTVGNITILANWIENTCNITYDLEPGCVNSNKLQLKYTELPYTLLPAEKEGYTFLGWYSDSGYVTKITTINELEDVTIYGKFESAQFEFELNPSQTSYSLKSYKADERDVVIPSTYNGLPVTGINYGAFNSKQVVNVTFPEQLDTIDANNFIDCNNLTSYQISGNNPNFYVDGNCLVDRRGMKIVKGLKVSTISYGIETIDNYAFSTMPIETVTFPETVRTIGEHAFERCLSLKQVVYSPNANLIIKWAAFNECENIETMELVNGITNIESEAFRCLKHIDHINIPRSLNMMGEKAFAEMDNLLTITCDDQNSKYVSDGNCLINKETNSIVLGCKNSIIPSYVSKLERYSFAFELRSIVIPSNITSVQDAFFMGPEEVFYEGNRQEWDNLHIGSRVHFYNMFMSEQLQDMPYPERMWTYGYFSDGNRYVKINGDAEVYVDGVYYRDNGSGYVAEHYNGAGDNVYFLSTINGKKVTEINDHIFDDMPFEGKKFIKKIYLPSGLNHEPFMFRNGNINAQILCEFSMKPEFWPDDWAGNCTVQYGVKNPIVDDSELYTVQDNGMDVTITGYKGLQGEVIIPSTINGKKVVGINANAFNMEQYQNPDIKPVEAVFIPKSITKIQNGAFRSCTHYYIGLEVDSPQTGFEDGWNDMLPVVYNVSNQHGITQDGLRWIKNKNDEYILASLAPQGPATMEISISTLRFGNEERMISKIADYAFANIYLDRLEISNVREIGNAAFKRARIRNLILNDGIEIIGNNAFEELNDVQTIKLPSTVRTIGKQAFMNCYAMNVIIPRNIQNIGAECFMNSGSKIYYEGTQSEWQNVMFGLGNDPIQESVMFYSLEYPQDIARKWHYNEFNEPIGW